jgi:hypothetical protein
MALHLRKITLQKIWQSFEVLVKETNKDYLEIWTEERNAIYPVYAAVGFRNPPSPLRTYVM